MEERIIKIKVRNIVKADSLPNEIEYSYSKLIKFAAFVVIPLLYLGFVTLGLLDFFRITLPIIICLLIVVIVVLKVVYDEDKKSGFRLTKRGIFAKGHEVEWNDIKSIEQIAKHQKGGRSTYFYLKFNLKSEYVEVCISNLNYSESDIIRMTISFYESAKHL